jgi:hypothetical protein
MVVELGQHTSVLGETGAGKTYWSRDTLEKARRVLVVDTEEGFDFSPKDWEVVTLDQLKRSSALGDASKPFHWAFRPRPGMEEEDVDALCVLLIKRARSMWVYFDEVTDYSDASTCPPALKLLFRKGRKRRISVMASTQRPAGFNHWFSENSQHKILFYFGRYDGDNTSIGRFMNEHRDEVPYGSYKYIYVAPGDVVSIHGGKE